MIQIAARLPAPPAAPAAEAMPVAAREARDCAGFAQHLDDALGEDEAAPDAAAPAAAPTPAGQDGKPAGKSLPETVAGLPIALPVALPVAPLTEADAPPPPAPPPAPARTAARMIKPAADAAPRPALAEAAPAPLAAPATPADQPALRLLPAPDAAALAAPEPQASGPTASPATTPVAVRPHDLSALIDRLVEARQAAAPAAVAASVAHGDFGRVTLTFAQDAAGLSVSLASRDPEFAPAVQAAMQAEPRPVMPTEAGGNAPSLSAGRDQGQSARSDGGPHHQQRREGEGFVRRPAPSAATPSGDDQPRRRGLFA